MERTTSGIEDIVQSYLDLRWNISPVEATSAGVWDQTDRFGNYTEEDVRAHSAALKSIAGALEEIDPASLDEEIDRTALLGAIRASISVWEREKWYSRNPSFWLEHVAEGFYVTLSRVHVPVETRQRVALSRLLDLPRFLDDARATLAKSPPVFVEVAEKMISGTSALLDQVDANLRMKDDGGWDEALGLARKALDEFGDHVQGLSDPLSDFAVGEEQFNFRLHHQHALQATAPELWRYGWHLVEEVESQIEELARDIEPGVEWREVVSRLRVDHPEAPELLDAYVSEMNRAREFVVSRNLVDLPDGPLTVIPTPDFIEPLVPYAAYEPPGCFEESREGFFYVTVPGVLEEARLADHSSYEIPITALHEAYPGHHTQILTAQAQPSAVRRFLGTPSLVEGWALYCEELLAEEGFYQTPEELIMQRVQLLWRAVRILVDVGLHTRNMSLDDARNLLVQRACLEPENALAEVRRYCSTPTYQMSYAVGRREILALRNDFRRQNPDAPLLEFHRRFLAYGAMPVSLIRWGMGLDQD